MNLVSIKREYGQNNEQCCKPIGNWSLELLFSFIFRLVHRKGHVHSPKAQIFRCSLRTSSFVCVWIVSSLYFTYRSCAWNFPQTFTKHTFKYSSEYFFLCSIYSQTSVLAFFPFTLFCLMLLCCFRATQMLLSAARSPLSTPPPLFIFFRPHTGRPQPHTLLTCTHTHSYADLPLHARLIDSWSLWLTLASYISDKLWQRQCERAAGRKHFECVY